MNHPAAAPRFATLPKGLTLTLLAVAVGSAWAAETTDLGAVGRREGGSSEAAADARTTSKAAQRAPSQTPMDAMQPKAVVTRETLENVLRPVADFTNAIALTPSIASTPSANGPGLGEAKATLRGFQDGEYNVTFDGIPFGDTNNPTHHSTAYFPASVIGGVVVERGPGGASNLGQATFGGSVNLASRRNATEQTVSPYVAFGNWNTQLRGITYDTGLLPSWGDASLQLGYERIASDGYLSGNSLAGENYVLKLQKPLGERTLATLFLNYNRNWYHAPDKAGATLAQVAAYGKNFSLNGDPTSQNYTGYNLTRKSTHFDYLGLESDLGDGWKLDNKLYTYAYTNDTLSGQDASGATANTTKNAAGTTLTGNVPGYTKLNAYRVIGDILKISRQMDAGLARAGLWFETADTDRNTLDLDLTTGLPNYKESTAPKNVAYLQNSSWKQYQPFAEFEWAVAPDVTVTPGVKLVHFTRTLNADVNQTTRVAQTGAETYKSTLPFLAANARLDPQWSTYAQYAKGMLVPDLSMFYVNNPSLSSVEPQTSTNYQVGVVHKSRQLAADFDLYYIDFNNKIASTGTGNDLVYYNQGGVIYKGAEGQATYAFENGFSLYVNGTVNRARSKATGLQIAKAPVMTAALGVLYNDGPWAFSLIDKLVGRQNAKDNVPTAYAIGSYSSLDLSAAYTLRGLQPWMKSARVQFNLYNINNNQNITSISASSKGAQYDQYTFQPARSAMLSLRGEF